MNHTDVINDIVLVEDPMPFFPSEIGAGKVGLGLQTETAGTFDWVRLISPDTPLLAWHGADTKFSVVGWLKRLSGNAQLRLNLTGSTASYISLECNVGFPTRIAGGTGGTAYANILAFTPMPLNTWVFFCMKADTDHMTIEFNHNGGVTSTVADSFDNDPQGGVFIDAIDFEIDELAVFDYLLSEPQQAALYNGGDGVTWPIDLDL